MRVRQATRMSDGHAIKVINAQDVSGLSDDDYGIIRRVNDISTPGPVRYMILGLEDGLVRWVQVPEAPDTCQLLVERMPLHEITEAGQTFDGVSEEHHYHFLKWMRHLAYRKQDIDRFNLVKSDQERDDFQQYCALALREKSRRRHKVRTVQYGGL
jgi:hypothetical protein